MANVLDLIRPLTVLTSRDITDDDHYDHNRQTTKNYSAGKRVSQIDKRTGTINMVCGLDRDTIHGSLRGTTIIKQTIELVR